MKRAFRVRAALLAIAALAGVLGVVAAQEPLQLLNVSYDLSRELFTEVNPAFAERWKAKTGQHLQIRQSHGGSSKQARSVIEGLAADVVTFNQVTDVEALRRAGLVAADWQARFPNQAAPYYSLPVFLVRKGNPKGIRDWGDLVKPGVQVVFPNPKTSGNGRYTYFSAFAYAQERAGGDSAQATAFVRKLIANVPVLDTGGRGATTTFVERGIGDALVTFESEVITIRREYGKSELEVVVPSLSVRADFPVAVVDKVVTRHGTGAVAKAYLDFLFSEAGQEILARNHFRVNSPEVAARYAAQFPQVRLVTVDEAFGGWANVTRTHLGEGGLLDQALARN